jgi:alkanesulfonate monooxygenase SsuD/methylene tetrahydromethanopterin reductase-like flavin-dependent oxidoreductase (luciferase family)
VLAGGPDEVTDQIRAYVDAGVTHFIAMVFAPHEAHRESLRRFAEEVIPRFR